MKKCIGVDFRNDFLSSKVCTDVVFTTRCGLKYILVRILMNIQEQNESRVFAKWIIQKAILNASLQLITMH